MARAGGFIRRVLLYAMPSEPIIGYARNATTTYAEESTEFNNTLNYMHDRLSWCSAALRRVARLSRKG